MVTEDDKVVADTRLDNLGEMVERYATVRRISPLVLDAFTFRSWKPDDSLLAALDVVRSLHATGARNLPPHPPTAFLKSAWRKLVGTGCWFPPQIDPFCYLVVTCHVAKIRRCYWFTGVARWISA
jgi:hypothetical protein